jgi:putative aldouronate transport system permease protein
MRTTQKGRMQMAKTFMFIELPRKKKKKLDINNLQLWSLCLIPIVLIFIFSYLPMGGIIIAFKNYNYSKGIFGSDWVGFDNFKFLFQSNDFVRIIRNTLCMNALFILFGTIAALTLAVFLFELKSRTVTKVYQTILITPNFLSWVVVAYMAYAILNPSSGTLNQVLAMARIAPVDWYVKPNAWPIILILSSIWKGIGMSSVIYYAAMMGFDTAILEAAEIDGANKLQSTIYILLPGLKNLVIILTMISIGNIFRADFGLFYQIPRNVGALYATTDVIDTYVFRTMRTLGNMGTSSATGLIQSVVGFILVIFTNYCAKRIDSDSGLF